MNEYRDRIRKRFGPLSLLVLHSAQSRFTNDQMVFPTAIGSGEAGTQRAFHHLSHMMCRHRRGSMQRRTLSHLEVAARTPGPIEVSDPKSDRGRGVASSQHAHKSRVRGVTVDHWRLRCACGSRRVRYTRGRHTRCYACVPVQRVSTYFSNDLSRSKGRQLVCSYAGASRLRLSLPCALGIPNHDTRTREGR